jgi:hypothetical protein
VFSDSHSEVICLKGLKIFFSLFFVLLFVNIKKACKLAFINNEVKHKIMLNVNQDSIITLYETEIRRQVQKSLQEFGKAHVLIDNDNHMIDYQNDDLTFFIGEDECEDNNRIISMEIDIQNIIQEEEREVETFYK